MFHDSRFHPWTIFKPTGYQITEQGLQHPSCEMWSIYYCIYVHWSEILLVWREGAHTGAVEGAGHSQLQHSVASAVRATITLTPTLHSYG